MQSREIAGVLTGKAVSCKAEGDSGRAELSSGVNYNAPARIHYDAQQEAPERSACLQGEAGEVEHPWNRVAEPGQNLHPGKI